MKEYQVIRGVVITLKGWLVNTAKAVQVRASLYEGQLKKCRYF